MKISIITVCYNSAKTIAATILSVAEQSFEKVEYIIVDGGSTDETLDIIKSNEANITKWISEKDEGLYDAMNKGIKMASGEIIGILNSDDIFASNDVLRQVSDFHSANEIDASIGSIVQRNAKGRVIRKYDSKSWTPKKLAIGSMPPHPSIFFKKEVFEKHGYYSLDFVSGADYEFITRVFLKNKISYKYAPILTTSMAIGGISSSGLKSYLLISKEIKSALEKNAIDFSKLKVDLRVLWKIFGYLKL